MVPEIIGSGRSSRRSSQNAATLPDPELRQAFLVMSQSLENSNRLANRLLELGTGETPRAHAHDSSSVKLSYAHLPELSTSDPEGIDNWFLAFEALLSSRRIPDDERAERFVECPRVPETLKTRARRTSEQGSAVYDSLRRDILHEYGPTDPVAHYRRRLHHVKADSVTEAKETILHLLTLHNRAAHDDLYSELTPYDLCFCLIDAMPAAISRPLQSNYPLVVNTPGRFETLFRMAKAKEDEQAPTVLLASRSTLTPSKRRADDACACAENPPPPVLHPVHLVCAANAIRTPRPPRDLRRVPTFVLPPTAHLPRLWRHVRIPIPLPRSHSTMLPLRTRWPLRQCLSVPGQPPESQPEFPASLWQRSRLRSVQ